MAGRNKTVRFHLIRAHSWDWNLRTLVWLVLERYVCGWSIVVSVRVCLWLKTWNTVTECIISAVLFVIECRVYICKISTFEVCSCFNVYCKRYCIHAWLFYTVKIIERGEQEYSFHMVIIVATCSEWDYRPNHPVLTITLFLACLHILWPHWWCCCGIASSSSNSQSICTSLWTSVFCAMWKKAVHF